MEGVVIIYVWTCFNSRCCYLLDVFLVAFLWSAGIFLLKKSFMNENSCQGNPKIPINKTTQPFLIWVGFPLKSFLEINHPFPPRQKKKNSKRLVFWAWEENKTTHLPYSLRGLWGIQQPGAFGGAQPSKKPTGACEERRACRDPVKNHSFPGELSE